MPVKTKAFSSDSFWRQSIRVGRFSEMLARDFLPSAFADHAYLAGAMINIGKLLAAMIEPEAVDSIYMDSIGPKVCLPWTRGESKHHGSSHVILGEIAATIWGFPRFIIDAIVNHHTTPSAILPLDLKAITAMANQMTHIAAGETHILDDGLVAGLSNKLGLDPSATGELAAAYSRACV